jgi:hypothetical protein
MASNLRLTKDKRHYIFNGMLPEVQEREDPG